MRSLLHWYLHGSRPLWAGILGACEIIQGISRHFTAKWSYIPPWLMITVGAIVLAGTVTRYAFGRRPAEPPAPQAPFPPGPRTFPAQLPPPGPAFIFRQPR